MKTLLPEIDSKDKRFHAGNPTTGEQGTRVTETWLNDVQDCVRDVQTEAHYVLSKAGFTPKAETQTQLYQAIVKIIDDNRKQGTTTQRGEVQLTDDTGLDSDRLGLSARAGKKLAQLIATIQTALNNYIPNNKKSSRVDSNSTDTVADSAAVKKAYDKGVSAQQSADNKLPLTGGTVAGDLVIDKTAKNEWSALALKSKTGHYRFEGNPDDSDNRLNIVHQTGNTQKYLRMRKFEDGEYFAYENWVKDGFAPLSNPNFNGTIKGNYRLVIDRNEDDWTPYINLKDSSVDISKTLSKNKIASEINAVVNNGTSEKVVGILRTVVLSDKNTNGYYGVAGSDGAHRWAWSAFGATGNVAIGKTTDDGKNRLQVNGSISSTNAFVNNNQVQHHGMTYATVAKKDDSTYVGLSAVLNESWYARFESVADKRWKFIYNGDYAYYLPRNTTKDKTIATLDDCTANLVTLFKGEYHASTDIRNVTVGSASGNTITLTQSFKNFKYIVVVTSNDQKTCYDQKIMLTSLIPVGNTNAATWGFESVAGWAWSGRFIANNKVQCNYESSVLHAIYGTNAI